MDLRRDFENTSQVRSAVGSGLPWADRGCCREVQTLLAPEQVAELVDAYESGATTVELSESFAIHRRTVVLHLHRQGVSLRRGGLVPEHVNEAADLYRSGLSLAKIAARFSTSAHTVRRALISLDVEMRTPWQHMREPGT